MMAGKNRNVYMDVMRAISCILIIGGHVTAYNWDDASAGSFKYQVLNISDNICALGVPLFIMMSGALHLNAEYKLTIKNLLIKKFLRIFITYYFWLLFYNIFSFVQNGYEWSLFNIKFHIVGQMVRGQGIYHLWFIPKLMFMYLLTPIIKEGLKDKKNTLYTLIIYVFVIIGIPTLFQFSFPGKDWIEYNFDMDKFYAVTSTFGYLGYYIAGHYVHSFVGPLKKYQRVLSYIILAGSTFAAIILGYMRTVHLGIADTTFINPLYLPEFIGGISLFILFKDWCMKLESKGSPKWLQSLGKLTFGIYLVHPVILKFFPMFGISVLSPQPYIMIPLLVSAVFVISLGISYLLNKIPIMRKWIL